MPRLRGFRNEDYELAEEIRETTGYPIRPSQACDAAEKWVLIKLRSRSQELRNLGWHDQANALNNFAYRLEMGEI